MKDKGYKVVERFSFDKEDMTLQFYINDKELDIPCEQISGGELIKNLNKCGVVPTVTNEIKTEFFNFSLDSAEADEKYFSLN